MRESISIRIMENDYQLVCDTNERDLIKKGAEHLNKTLIEFRKANPSMPLEKALIMGALSANCELLNNINLLSAQIHIANNKLREIIDY